MRPYVTGWWLAMVLAVPAAAQAPAALPSADFGRSEAEVAPGVPVTVNPKAEEEAKLQRTAVPVLGRTAAKAEYTFWNHRLSDMRFEFPLADFDALAAALTAAYGQPWKQEETKSGREAAWSLPAQAAAALHQSNGVTVLLLWDRSQKEFRWSDLAHGSAPKVVGAFLGLVFLMFFIPWLLTSWCPKCHSFGMQETGRMVEGYRDHSPDPTSVNYRADVSYRYQCSKCGHKKTDRYSGFWDRNR